MSIISRALTTLSGGAVRAKHRGDGSLSNPAVPYFLKEDENASIVDRSGTITTANVGQIIAAPQAGFRVYLLLQNISAGDLWFDLDAVAVVGPPSIRLVPGQLFVCDGSFIPSDQVAIAGATAEAAFICKEGLRLI